MERISLKQGYRELSTGVLLQAFTDLKMGTGKFFNTAKLFFESGDFTIYSDMLELNQSMVYDAYRSVIKNKSDQGFLSFFEEE